MTIRDGVQWGQTQIGKSYCTDWARRFGPDCYDCSGFVTRVLEHAGMPPGALPTNSADMARWLRRNERYRLSRTQARAQYGAIIVYGGINGYGPDGHVGISLGDGRTLEAASSRGVAIYGFDRLEWSDYFLAPDVDYNQPAPPAPIPPIQQETDRVFLIRGNKTPEVYICNGVSKTHITAEAYPFWLFFMAGRPGGVDPTTRKEWVVDEKMLSCIPRVPAS
jgi:cell wall-associated NlpC family hydrolase